MRGPGSCMKSTHPRKRREAKAIEAMGGIRRAMQTRVRIVVINARPRQKPSRE